MTVKKNKGVEMANPKKACVHCKWFKEGIENEYGDPVCLPKIHNAQEMDMFGKISYSFHRCDLWNVTGACPYFVSKNPISWYKKILTWLDI